MVECHTSHAHRSGRWLALLAGLTLVMPAGCGDDGPGPMSWLMYFLTWILGSIAVGAAAGRWGRSEGGYVLGALVFSPLLAGLMLIAGGPEQRACWQCRTSVRFDAACPQCGAPPRQPAPPPPLMWQQPGYGPPPPSYGAPQGWAQPIPAQPVVVAPAVQVAAAPQAPTPEPPAASVSTAPPIVAAVAPVTTPAPWRGWLASHRRVAVAAGVGGLVMLGGGVTTAIVCASSDDAPAKRAPAKSRPATKPRR